MLLNSSEHSMLNYSYELWTAYSREFWLTPSSKPAYLVSAHLLTYEDIYLWGQTLLQNSALLLAVRGHVTTAPGQWGRGVLLTEFTLLYHRSVGRGAPSRPHVTQCDAMSHVTILLQLWHVTRDTWWQRPCTAAPRSRAPPPSRWSRPGPPPWARPRSSTDSAMTHSMR